MNDLTVFANPEFGEIRALEIDGEPWLVGKDVAQVLGYKNPSNALYTHVDDEDKSFMMLDIADTQNGDVPIGQTKTAVINESGLYSLILSSKLPTAKKFKRWVTSEVLPSIRKNGGYIAGQESMTPEELMAAALLMANKTIESQKARLSALTVENQILLPKADYFDELVDRNLLTNFRDTAKQFHVKPKTFISFLLEKKYIYRDAAGKLLPCQRYVSDGLFELKESFNEKTGWKGMQTLITPKGRETFRLLFVGAV